VILVSNEVGWGVVPATASGRAFRDLMGIVNSVLATACTQTTLVVTGRAIALEESGTR
jgi:adenosylcobinamide kinase/adenosylcobinamide-phosphate guanylyltransferase